LSEYNEIDWGKAACRESVYTDIFYNVEEERSLVAYEYINALRTICLACPIWKTCLTYAMEHEDYGVWGGMTSIERFSFRNPEKYPNQHRRALFAFEKVGISLAQIMECVKDEKEEL
jgi:hypothetical protein